MNLRPFFYFFGSKWKAAPLYPAPRFNRVIEPFAGSAGYSGHYHERDVVLVERDPIIAGLWRWLIKATGDDVLSLPLEIPTTVRDLGLDPGPAALIGFWCNKGAAAPMQSPAAWMRGGTRPTAFWGEKIRTRIADQVGMIKHWTVIEGDYTDAPAKEATYFVDPPYANKAGSYYRMKFTNHAALGDWCRTRPGQVIVCENDGATWLPFRHFRMIKSNPSKHGKGTSSEAIWLSDEHAPLPDGYRIHGYTMPVDEDGDECWIYQWEHVSGEVSGHLEGDKFVRDSFGSWDEALADIREQQALTTTNEEWDAYLEREAAE